MNVVVDEAEEVYDCGSKPGKDVPPKRDLGEFYALRDILLQASNVGVEEGADAICRKNIVEGRQHHACSTGTSMRWETTI